MARPERPTALGLPRYAPGPPAARRPRDRTVLVNVLPDDIWLEARRGDNLLDVLKKGDVDIDAECGGLGQCGKCKVRILSSIDLPPEQSREHLSRKEIGQGIRLACHTVLQDDLIVWTGDREPESEYVQILQTGARPLFQLEPLVDRKLINLRVDSAGGELSYMEQVRLAMGPVGRRLEPSLWCLRSIVERMQQAEFRGAAVYHADRLIAWQAWEDLERYYGLTLDLGTSTLVGKLVNLLDGTVVAAISRLNGQLQYGADVISRLKYIKENSDGLERLHTIMLRDINRIVQRLLEVEHIDAGDVYAAVVAGNTTMQHIFLRVDPTSIAEVPFVPVVKEGVIARASELDLGVHPEAPCHVVPSRSGYIGGDLIAVILASGAAEQNDELVLGLDLGTNGEIFLGNADRILTCSAAAGPAFEGANISHGMIARGGAIEAVLSSEHKSTFVYRIVGNIEPRGLCGSGLVDLVALLLHCGIIDPEGLIGHVGDERLADLDARVVERAGAHAFMVAPPEEAHGGRAIFLTQRDVRELQLAKAAIAAGVESLLEELGVGPGDIDKVLLTGAFGNYINAHSALRIGLLPAFDPGVITTLGNAASTGANMMLLSKMHWRRAEELSERIEYIALSARPTFMQRFVEQMDFPEDNLW